MKERPILMSDVPVRGCLDGSKTQTRRILKPQPPSVESVYARAGTGFSIFTDHHTPDRFRVGGPVWAVREAMGIEPEWRCPHGAPGDRLWVRECFARTLAISAKGSLGRETVTFRADAKTWAVKFDGEGDSVGLADPVADIAARPKWRPSIHMPRWASRLTLEVTGVKVERLNDINEEDAKAEGCSPINATEEWIATRGTAHGWSELISLHAEPSAATIAEQGLRNVRHNPAHAIVTAQRQFQTLWESIHGAGSWALNPWCWAISFRKVEP